MSRGAALRQMAGEVYQLLHRGCQFEFRTTNETHRGRTSKGMPTKLSSYCKLHEGPEPAALLDIRYSNLIKFINLKRNYLNWKC